MQTAPTYQTEQNPLWKLANKAVVAIFVVLVALLTIKAFNRFWPATPASTPAAIVAPVDAVTPCTAISDECANVTPQPATDGPHATLRAKGSTLPLLANGARFEAGTDVQCYWATVYKVPCSDVKAFGEQYKFNGDN